MLNPVGAEPITAEIVSVHIPSISALPQLRGLLEVSRLVRDEHDLTRLIDRIAETISESLGFRAVAINLYRPTEGDFQVAAVHGNHEAREALIGTSRSADDWTPYLDNRFLRRGAYLIPHDEIVWEGVLFHVPDLPLGTDPDAWHPEDALIVPMRANDGRLLGVVSVDEPESGMRPTDEELEVLVAFAEHVAAALEGASDTAAAARDRAALSRMLDVSASLVELDSVDSILNAVAHGISDALGFEKVVVGTLHDEGRFVPTGTAGWDANDPGLAFSLTQADLDALLVPAFELEGCYLIENEIANAVVGNRSNYTSQRGGAGPLAWRRHLLIVPLVERDGPRRGFIWADDPVDSMLPSRERLQALRTFANQATMALRAAEDLQTLNARNAELAALHETAFGLLERPDLDSVLYAIVDNARQLARTPNAYLYLSDAPDADFKMRVGLGLFEEHVGRIAEPGLGASGKVLLCGETVVVEDYRDWGDRLVGYDEIAFRAVAAVPLRAGGRVVGVIGLARQDATAYTTGEIALLERFALLAELALENARLYATMRQSEELHRHVVDGSTDLIALLGPDSRIVLASRAYSDVLGYEPGELLGSLLSDLVHPDDLTTARATVVDGVIAEPMVARLRHRDGHWVRVEGTASPIKNEAGELQLELVIVRDITERERLQEQLRQAQKMESIGRLAGGIAHDFNNLLTAIRGYSELMLIDFDAGTAPSRESAEQIALAAGRAAALTSQLLAYSRKQVLRPQVIDLNEIVAGMAAMLAPMLGEQVVLSTALDSEIGPILADPTQIEQVVLNLAINSRDAMPGGGNLVLTTASFELHEAGEPLHPDLQPGPYITLTVRDTGVGIEPTVAEQVFEPFFTTKNVGEGTGLGLATVHGIVSQSGGAIWVDSVPGEGTSFTVCLPLAPESE
ncbi:MAG: GAF domain-containing protein [Actinomycetota bacterium]|nr:GAF domain-containing protein [Actinomycetota bacterium]